MKRWLSYLLLIAWLLPGLACNLPTGPVRAPQTPAQSTLAPGIPTPALGAIEGTRPPAVDAATPLPAGNDILPGNSSSRLDSAGYHYVTRPGDTLKAIALRFGVEESKIQPSTPFAAVELLPAGLQLDIPNALSLLEALPLLLPDEEVVFSPAAAGFSVDQIVQDAGGFLSTYQEAVDGETLSGAAIVDRAALETSINPRLLLAFLDYRSGWVTGSPANPGQVDYPIGFYAGEYRGLYKELLLTARQLTIGYYGWRSGALTSLAFVGGAQQRIDPLLNPGTVALQYLFSKLYNAENWRSELYTTGRFLEDYSGRYGDPWVRAAGIESPLFAGLQQPALELPFQPGETWTLTGGPHVAWGVGSTWGGLDFAPADVEPGCTVTRYWATAAASGLVTRSSEGVVAIDLDGDGFEGSGWVLVYLHIAEAGRVSVGTRVALDERIGHPSCEGGVATGTHVHLARKYNGEWLNAEWPVPFVLSGWQAWMGDQAYYGSLTRADQMVTSRLESARSSLITR